MNIVLLLWQLISRSCKILKLCTKLTYFRLKLIDNILIFFLHFVDSNNEDGSETDGTSFHRVFIYESALREYIQNNLKKSDRILLNGKIGHMTSTGPDGKKVYSGFIVADNLYRIARRTTSQSESNESTEIKAEN